MERIEPYTQAELEEKNWEIDASGSDTSDYVTTYSETTQLIDSDLTLAVDRKLLLERADGSHEVAMFCGVYGPSISTLTTGSTLKGSLVFRDRDLPVDINVITQQYIGFNSGEAVLRTVVEDSVYSILYQSAQGTVVVWSSVDGWLEDRITIPVDSVVSSATNLGNGSADKWTYKNILFNVYEQEEIASMADPTCINHNSVSTNGQVVGKNIIVNYRDENGVAQEDNIAYLSDIPEVPPMDEFLTEDEANGLYLRLNPSTVNDNVVRGLTTFKSPNNSIALRIGGDVAGEYNSLSVSRLAPLTNGANFPDTYKPYIGSSVLPYWNAYIYTLNRVKLITASAVQGDTPTIGESSYPFTYIYGTNIMAGNVNLGQAVSTLQTTVTGQDTRLTTNESRINDHELRINALEAEDPVAYEGDLSVVNGPGLGFTIGNINVLISRPTTTEVQVRMSSAVTQTIPFTHRYSGPSTIDDVRGTINVNPTGVVLDTITVGTYILAEYWMKIGNIRYYITAGSDDDNLQNAWVTIKPATHA